MADGDGRWYFKMAYGIQLNSDLRDLTNSIAGELSSQALDFYFKHITTVKAGGYYEYRAQYLEELPCVTSETGNEFDRIDGSIRSIIETIDTENKTERFPQSYLGDFSGELEYVDYEWQTARRPVSASIETSEDGGFAVAAGHTDEIRDPRMDSEARVRYVHSAVDGRKVKESEVVSIPIPRRDADVEALLEDLETDRQAVAETDIEALEAEIDEIVYDLFELTEEERQVIEDLLDVF